MGIIEKIKALDITKYFEMYGKRFESLPTHPAMKQWNAYKESLDNGQPFEHIENEEEKAVYEYIEHEQYFEKKINEAGFKTIDYEDFKSLVEHANNSASGEIRTMKAYLLFQVYAKPQYLSQKMGYYLSMIDPHVIEKIIAVHPIFKDEFWILFNNLPNIIICNWILKELKNNDLELDNVLLNESFEKIQETPTGKSTSNKVESLKLQWKGKPMTLYFLMYRLHQMEVGNKEHERFVPTSFNSIAQFIHESIEMRTKPKVAGIVSQLKQVGLTVNSPEKRLINNILEEIEVFEKLMQMAGIE